MKVIEFVIAVALTAPAGAVLAQSGEMKGMEMKGMDMDKKAMSKGDKAHTTHQAVGVVKKVDRKDGSVTLAHEPVKSMNWPAMVMAFKVQDKAMLEKLAVDKKVAVEFQQRGKDHVITSVK